MQYGVTWCWLFVDAFGVRLSNLWDHLYCASIDETPRSQDSVTRVRVRRLHTTGLSMKKLRRTYTRESVLFTVNNFLALDRVYVFKFWIWTWWCEPVSERLLRKPLNGRFVSLVVAGVKVVQSPRKIFENMLPMTNKQKSHRAKNGAGSQSRFSDELSSEECVSMR
jgi:hypothetical protein